MTVEIFHEGERRVQQRVGVTEEADRNSPMIGTQIPSGAIRFLEGQSLLIFALEQSGAMWCLPLTGKANWLSASRDAIDLDLKQTIDAVDERVLDAAGHARAVGCVALDFATRRRLRINGWLERGRDDHLILRVREAYPNCPQYITQRTLAWPGGGGQRLLGGGQALGVAQRETLRATDVFFIATQHPERGPDASHRGGNPGFVESVAEDTFRFPDYAGNNLFNTLGNLEVDPRVGVLVPDFQAGRALALTGTASVSFDDGGRTRWVTVRVESWFERPLSATETAKQFSPFNP